MIELGERKVLTTVEDALAVLESTIQLIREGKMVLDEFRAEDKHEYRYDWLDRPLPGPQKILQTARSIFLAAHQDYQREEVPDSEEKEETQEE